MIETDVVLPHIGTEPGLRICNFFIKELYASKALCVLTAFITGHNLAKRSILFPLGLFYCIQDQHIRGDTGYVADFWPGFWKMASQQEIAALSNFLER